jgi:hypothetical protein
LYTGKEVAVDDKGRIWWLGNAPDVQEKVAKLWLKLLKIFLKFQI